METEQNETKLVLQVKTYRITPTTTKNVTTLKQVGHFLDRNTRLLIYIFRNNLFRTSESDSSIWAHPLYQIGFSVKCKLTLALLMLYAYAYAVFC